MIDWIMDLILIVMFTLLGICIGITITLTSLRKDSIKTKKGEYSFKSWSDIEHAK